MDPALTPAARVSEVAGPRRLLLLVLSLWLAVCVLLGILRAAVDLRAVSRLWDLLAGV